jgi:hypothetical protein
VLEFAVAWCAWEYLAVFGCCPRGMQNAECVALFPVPLPRPGFYSASLTSFSSCVPASACPGVDAQRVAASLRALLQGGVSEQRQVCVESAWGQRKRRLRDSLEYF